MKQITYKLAGVYNMIEIKNSEDYLSAYKPHLHEELSIGIIQKGQAIIPIRGVDHVLCEGDAVVIYPYVTHDVGR